MRVQLKMQYKFYTALLAVCVMALSSLVHADPADPVYEASTDRIAVVTQQIRLLKNRYQQSERELALLQRDDKQWPIATIEQASKNFLDKAALDISIARSNYESINIELADARQTSSWLVKNIQEIDSQLNALKIFGSRIASSNMINVDQLHADLTYQKKLVVLEQERVRTLRELQVDAAAILQVRKDQLTKLNAQLKSQRLLRMKQQEVRDELAFQMQQNQWLQQVSNLYARLATVNPVTAREQYAQLEDEIFIANENASLAYTQSLIARYRDQINQLRMVVLKSSSLSQLSELAQQAQLLDKQTDRLNAVLVSRTSLLGEHGATPEVQVLQKKYQDASLLLKTLDARLAVFRILLDKAMQAELSSRQGLPSFDVKSLIDIGKEILLVPALGFQVVKSLAVIMLDNVKAANAWKWSFFAAAQILLAATFVLTSRMATYLLQRPSSWREKINAKWLSLKWLDHHFMDLYLLMNVISVMFIFNVPLNNYIFFLYLAVVWFIFKSIIMIARICLVETTSHIADKDMRLYQRLMWTFAVGGVTTAAAVFVYQLPLIYELKTLSDRLFLLFMMIVSLMLLRFWDVVPNLIVTHMEQRHPYFEKSIKALGVLVPLLLFANSVIGLVGYLNLVMTISWYEGVFLVVLIGYLTLRGLLSDSVEQLSRVVIQHANNGWLLTEAFLKPLDRVLRLFLLFTAGAVLFLLYGWDKQSPIVEQLNALLHYKLVNVANTFITPISIVSLVAVISVFYWTAKWTREFVFRSLANRTSDMGIRNSVSILSQYAVVMLGIFFSLQVIGIDSRVLAAVTTALAFGMGLGLRDLANNFFCGFLILLERPLRVGDIICVNDIEGDVVSIGGRAVTVMTWDHTALVVPNAEIFNKTFTNLTARDNVLRCVVPIKISRHDNPHEVQTIIHQVISENRFILNEPAPEVFLKEMNDVLLSFELRYFVNIRQIKSRTMVISALLMAIWDAFEHHDISHPYPQQEIFIRSGQQAATALLPQSTQELKELLQHS